MKQIKIEQTGKQIVIEQFENVLKQMSNNNFQIDCGNNNFSEQYKRELNIFVEGIGLGLSVENVFDNPENCHLNFVIE